ncbi:MAG: hypothetical protein J5507_04395 [Clostridia bacterium]|nr:hypothetical protein [Clostridia bacterium]
MSDLINRIKVVTDKKEKGEIFKKVLSDFLYKGIMQKNEIIKELEKYKFTLENDNDKYLKSIISPSEFTALVCIAQEYNLYGNIGENYFDDRKPERKKLIEYISSGGRLVESRLSSFIYATTIDIDGYNEFYGKGKNQYSLMMKHVFQILDGIDPYADERMEKKADEEARKKREGFQLIDGGQNGNK